MDWNWQETMRDAISEVLETMFFTPVEFVGEMPSPIRCACRSVIQLKAGEEVYEASFYFVDTYARMITANFLGKMDEEVTGDEVTDTLKEVANMVGGSFIFHGGLDHFKIGIPVFSRIEDQGQPDPRDGAPFFIEKNLFGLVTLTEG